MNWYVAALCLLSFVLGMLTNTFVMWVAMRDQIIIFMSKRKDVPRER